MAEHQLHYYPQMDMSDPWQRQRPHHLAELDSIPNHRFEAGKLGANLHDRYPHQIDPLADFPAYSMQPSSYNESIWQSPFPTNQSLQRFMSEVGPFQPCLPAYSFNIHLNVGGDTCSPRAPRAEGIASMPNPAMARMISPDPSQEQSSQCSSVQSPVVGNNEWYQNPYPSAYYSPESQAQDCQSMEHGSGGSRFPHVPPMPKESWALDRFVQKQTSFPQFSPAMTNPRHISLNQVQCFADLQDSQDVSNDDADFAYEETNNIYFKEETAPVTVYAASSQHPAPPRSTYLYNETISRTTSPRVKEETDISRSPSPQTSPPADDNDSESDSDPSFRPTAAKTRQKRRRKISSTPLAPNTKSTRVTKNTSPTSVRKSRASKSKDKSDQGRPFICIFAFAGCGSTFPSKNEWKRHVASQHVCLDIWICNQGTCAKSQRPNEFNRKDLFTQHLRRMHAQGKDVAWEEKMQTVCRREKVRAPSKTGCGMQGCAASFEGGTRDARRKAWDERMEHVGRHLEQGIHTDPDVELLRWAAEVGVIELRGGRWQLRNGNDDVDLDLDAEGESE